MGSSTSKCIYSDILSQRLGISVLNVGLDGAALIYSRCLLQLVVEHNVKPKIIILNLDTFEFTKSAWSGNFYSKMESLAPLYGSSRYIDNVLEKNSLIESIKYKLASYKYNDLILAISQKRLQGQQIYAREPARSTSLILTSEAKSVGRDEITDETIDQRKFSLLDDFITECKKNEIMPILITTPVYGIKGGSLTNKLRIQNLIQQLATRHDIRFIKINQQTDSRFANPSLFYDELHLNDRGARLFSVALCDRLLFLKR